MTAGNAVSEHLPHPAVPRREPGARQSQIGGRLLDLGGAKRPVVLGCVLAAVGFYLWGGDVTSLSFGAQQWDIILAGAGVGFMLGPASTDAVNRASSRRRARPRERPAPRT
ncbi:MAG TPA: hypothetical protein VF979_12400 [Streptosporangiaceae bacterium]